MAFRFKRPLSIEVLDKRAMLKSTLQWNAKLQQSFRLLMDFHNLESDESWVPVKLAMLSSSPYSEALALIQGSQGKQGAGTRGVGVGGPGRVWGPRLVWGPEVCLGKRAEKGFKKESYVHIVNFVNEKHDATIIRRTVQYT